MLAEACLNNARLPATIIVKDAHRVAETLARNTTLPAGRHLDVSWSPVVGDQSKDSISVIFTLELLEVRNTQTKIMAGISKSLSGEALTVR